tara:strand:- start:69 stop:560 length:492 start_codon:yes stop_codon:yes gene_type:complete
MNKLLSLFFLLLLTSCSTTNSISNNETIPELESGSIAKGKIFVLRNTGGYGFLNSLEVRINKESIGKIKNSQMVMGSFNSGWNSILVKYSGFIGEDSCNQSTASLRLGKQNSYFFIVFNKKEGFFECLNILRITEKEFLQTRKNPYTFTDEFIEEIKKRVLPF